VLVSVVGAEKKFAAVGQRRTHVRLGATTVATIAGRQFVDDLFFGLCRSRGHVFSLAQVGNPTLICNHEAPPTPVLYHRISLTAKGVPMSGGAHGRVR